MHPPALPRVLEWYRADDTRRIVHVVLTGSVLVTAGVAALALALGRPFLEWRGLWLAMGALGVLAGPALTIMGFQRLMAQEVCLALRTDGVCLHQAGADTLVSWDMLDQVRWDAPNAALVLEGAHQPALVIVARFSGIDGPDLARRVQQVRRRALMNLLPR